MATITATVRGGRIEVDEPLNLPDGTRLHIPVPDTGDDGPAPPDEVARVLTAMERVEPLDLSADERAAWEAERKAHKEREKAAFSERGAKLKEMWDGAIPPG